MLAIDSFFDLNVSIVTNADSVNRLHTITFMDKHVQVVAFRKADLVYIVPAPVVS